MLKIESLFILLYHCERQLEDNSGRFLYIVSADRPTFGALSNHGLCHLCSVGNTTENLSKNKFTNKKQVFGLWRKCLSYNFHLWEKAYHRVFI